MVKEKIQKKKKKRLDWEKVHIQTQSHDYQQISASRLALCGH